jgi:hypothetical protein
MTRATHSPKPDEPAETAKWYPLRSGRRYDFVASIEVIEPKSGKQIVSTTSNLSAYGCHIRTDVLLPPETKVKLTIWHKGTFQSEGRVSHSDAATGMGIRFVNIDTAKQDILNDWLMRADNEMIEHSLQRSTQLRSSLPWKALAICVAALVIAVGVLALGFLLR